MFVGRLLGLIREADNPMTLLLGAGLLAKSFTRLMSVDPGFRTENLLTMKLALPPEVPGRHHLSLQRRGADVVASDIHPLAEPFLAFSARRDLREKVWRGRVERCRIGWWHASSCGHVRRCRLRGRRRARPGCRPRGDRCSPGAGP